MLNCRNECPVKSPLVASKQGAGCRALVQTITEPFAQVKSYSSDSSAGQSATPNVSVASEMIGVCKWI